MSEKVKKTKKHHYKPSWFVMWVLHVASNILLFFWGYKVKVDKTVIKKYKKGFILINNHYTNIDEFFIGKALGTRRINYVVSSHFFYSKNTGGLLRLAKAISKEQFIVDLKAIRQAISVLKDNGIIYIAPAGQVSVVGANNYIPESIVKLVKLANVPVIAMQERGAHMSLPKWAKKKTNKRRYPIELTFEEVLTTDDIKTLSDEEMFNRIYKSIDINDYLANEEKHIKIKGHNIIEGLENALFMCPKCKSMNTNNTFGNIMKCNNCGNTIYMDEYGYLNPQSENDKCFKYPYDWYTMQKQAIKDMIINNQIDVSSKYILRLYDEKKKDLVESGEGILHLSNTEFYYEGTMNGEQVKINYDLSKTIQIPFSCDHHVEVPDKDRFYQFMVTDGSLAPVRFAIVIEVMNDMKLGRI